nr:TetR/AcrR family transcriptional regulator [Arsenicicoccus dermatophilus]
MRADAERRRRAILDAAYEAFTEQGLDVPMDQIARAAGVGVGTLYRRFPDRTSLVVAVTEHHLGAVVATARTAVAQAPSAWEALVALLGGPAQILTMRRQLALHPVLAEAVRADDRIRALQTDLVVLLGRVVAAAQTEGTLRPDVDIADVSLLIGSVRRGVLPPGPDADRARERLQGMVLDALATGPRTPLPGAPLGAEVLGIVPGD